MNADGKEKGPWAGEGRTCKGTEKLILTDWTNFVFCGCDLTCVKSRPMKLTDSPILQAVVEVVSKSIIKEALCNITTTQATVFLFQNCLDKHLSLLKKIIEVSYVLGTKAYYLII